MYVLCVREINQGSIKTKIFLKSTVDMRSGERTGMWRQKLGLAVPMKISGRNETNEPKVPIKTV